MSEERCAVTLSSICDAAVAADDHARVTFLNPSAEAMTGWSHREAVGRKLTEIVQLIDEDRREAVEAVIGVSRRALLVARAGKEHSVDVSISSIVDDDGVDAGVIVVMRGLTDQRRAEAAEALKVAGARFELALAGSNTGVWDYALVHGKIDEARAYSINCWTPLGYLEKEHDFAARYELIHPEDRARMDAALTACFAGERRFEAEVRVRHSNGAYLWRLSTGVLVRDAQGTPVRLLGCTRDVDDAHRAEQALRESEARFRGTFENAGVGIAHASLDSRFLRVNQKFCDIVEYSREELLTMSRRDITHPSDWTRSDGAYAAAIRGEHASYSEEKRAITKHGRVIWIHLTVSIQSDAVGTPTHMIAIIQDVTQRRELEEALRQARDLAEAANRAKDDFLANVSHEIRTPMNAILGMTELVLDSSLSHGQRESLKAVMSAAGNLLGTINDLLDFSKIEAGKLTLDPSDFQLRSTLGDTLRALAARAHRKGLELVCNVDRNVPDTLTGDAGRLRQVLMNLVGNAIKFTEQGEVLVEVSATPGEAKHGQLELRFVVTDTGIGISKDKQLAVFKAFEQEDTSTTRKYGGTGLGLTIAAQLASLMSGALTLVSEPGRGSVFTFTARFRARSTETNSVDVRIASLLRDLRVLVVDDNAVNRHILEEWLRGWQMHPTGVSNAMAAMDALWHAVATGRPYALALLDARMPDTDGLSIAAKMRERSELSATRIVLLTSGDRPGDSERFRDLALDAHLLKPVPQDELLETIHQVMGRGERDTSLVARLVPRPEPIAPKVAASAPLHILVVEDNELNSRLLEKLLERRGHRVEVAKNGRVALDLHTHQHFDLMFLDLHMPEVDGFQVIKAIREREAHAGGHIPVIALTARSRKEDRERCLAAGIDAFLTKPLSASELWPTIERLVASNVEQASAHLLSPSVLLDACGGDEEVLKTACDALQARLPEQVAALRNALDARAPDRLRDAAHQLRGTASTFSVTVDHIASKIEALAADGDLGGATLLVEQLEGLSRSLLLQTSRLSIASLVALVTPPQVLR